MDNEESAVRSAEEPFNSRPFVQHLPFNAKAEIDIRKPSRCIPTLPLL